MTMNNHVVAFRVPISAGGFGLLSLNDSDQVLPLSTYKLKPG